MSIKKLLILAAAGVASVGTVAALAGGPDHAMMEMPVMAPAPVFHPYFYGGVSAGFAYSNWEDFGFGKFLEGSNHHHDDNNHNDDFDFDGDKTGFAWGGEIGWQFHPNFGVELGAYGLPDADRTIRSHHTDNNDDDNDHHHDRLNGHSHSNDNNDDDRRFNDDVDSWFAYVAAKMSVPVYKNPTGHLTEADVFGKIGPAYRRLKHDGHCHDESNDSGDCDDNNNNFGDKDIFSDENGHYWSVMFGAGVDFEFNNQFTVAAQYLFVPANDTDTDSNDRFANEAPSANVFVATFGYRLKNV